MNRIQSTAVVRESECSTSDGAAIRLSALHKDYGSIRAVRGIDLTIAPGEVVALLGPNGAGKSTTVDMILGLSTPDNGIVSVFGRTPAAAIAEGVVGAMLQGGFLLDDATVGAQVRLIASLHRDPMPVEKALRQAGILDIADRKGGDLSGGQAQRARFALALVSDPDLLLLDEPTAAMDVAFRGEFWRSMHAFTETGRTVVFATHYLAEAEDFADRVVLMREGRIVADGSVSQVRALAGGRTIRAVVPSATPAALAALPGVGDQERRGDRISLSSNDSDHTLRALLASFPDARDIEITAAGLEGAFLSLTAEEEKGADR